MYGLTNEEILQKWKQGLSKKQLALIYKREYNLQIKINRATVRNRHEGKFIDNYEALEHIEKIIYREIMKKTNK